MKTILLLLLGFFSLAAATEKITLNDNEHVSIQLHVEKKLNRGSSGLLKFFLSPNEGIHINTEPLFEIVLEKNSPFEIVGVPEFRKDDQSYLATKYPIVFTIALKEKAASGKRSLKGQLRYFYCSDAEGWCNRFSQKIDIPFDITQ